MTESAHPELSSALPYDVVILGGGPAGASAAIYTARADLRTAVIDKGLAVGALGTTGHISNYPGVPGPISGAELLATIRQQAQEFGAVFVTDRVVGVDFSQPDTKTVFTNQGVVEARSVIVATGAMGRATTIPGEERLLGRGVSYCATCDGAFFRNRPVAVAGNNDEALEEALFLARYASKVTVMSPTKEFNARAELVAELEHSPKVEVRRSTRVLSVEGKDSVEALEIAGPSGNERLAVDAAFIYLQGGRPVIDFLQGALETTPQGCLQVDTQLQTSAPGVFAVGDLLCTHVKQAVVAAADGVQAAMAVQRFLQPGKSGKVDWG